MTINQRVIAAVTPVVAVCKPEIYLPPENPELVEEIFCTFEVEEDAVCADDRPILTVYNCALHLFAPHLSTDGASVNTLPIRHQLRSAIAGADGFSAPSISDESDIYGQHFVLRFQVI